MILQNSDNSSTQFTGRHPHQVQFPLSKGTPLPQNKTKYLKYDKKNIASFYLCLVLQFLLPTESIKISPAQTEGSEILLNKICMKEKKR